MTTRDQDGCRRAAGQPAAPLLLMVPLLLLAASAPLSIAVSQASLGLSLLAGLCWWARGGRPQRTGLELWAALLVGWALVMIPFSGDRLQSLVFARRFYLLSAVWLLATTARSARFQRAVLVALVSGGVALSALGLVQVWRQGGGHYLDGSGQLVGRATLAQGYMTGGGVLMIVALVITAFLALPGSRRCRLLLGAALVPVSVSLVLTMTRSAWLGFCAGAVLLLLLTRPRRLPLLLLLLGACFAVMPSAYRARLGSAFDPRHPDNQQRVVMWRTGWRVLRDHPWTGVGDRDLKAVYRTYHQGEAVEIPGHLHGNLIMFGAIWGWPGLGLGLAFLVAIPVLLHGRWRKLRHGLQRGPPSGGPATASRPHELADAAVAAGWALAGLAVWCGFFVAGFFEWNFGDAEVALLVYMISGMGLAGRGIVEPSPQSE